MFDFFNKIIEFFDYIVTFITSGIYDLIVKWFAQFIISAQISMVKFKIFSLVFAWDVAKEIINQLSVSSYLQQAYNSLDSRIISLLNFFKIPDAINIILSARITKFVLKFMGL
jgi:beta-mannanase